jgi:hypothetical protein
MRANCPEPAATGPVVRWPRRAVAGTMNRVDDTAEPGPPPVRPEDMRAGDADRELVLERLRSALAEGRLGLDEFDERVVATLAARTYGELAVLTTDLPGEPPSPRPVAVPAPRVPPSPPARPDHEMRGAVAGWAGVSVTTIAIWTISCIATASFVYPWWLWVAGPWGLVLLWSWIQLRLQGR